MCLFSSTFNSGSGRKRLFGILRLLFGASTTLASTLSQAYEIVVRDETARSLPFSNIPTESYSPGH
jgi:hypothetical protein